MNDATYLFHTSDLLIAARAARGRIDAINANPNLHWLVEVRDGDHTVTLTFETAPPLVQIALRMREVGLQGRVDVKAITVGRKKLRPLLLMPWMRAKGEPALRSL